VARPVPREPDKSDRDPTVSHRTCLRWWRPRHPGRARSGRRDHGATSASWGFGSSVAAVHDRTGVSYSERRRRL